jgi:hypothetical protein
MVALSCSTYLGHQASPCRSAPSISKIKHVHVEDGRSTDSHVAVVLKQGQTASVFVENNFHKSVN